MYERILVAIDATPTEENRSALTRTEQIGRLTGATVHVLHVARAHIVPGDIIGGSGLGVLSAEDDVEAVDRQAVQQLVDRLAAAGIEAHGEIVSATEHDVAEVILQRAQELDVDLARARSPAPSRRGEPVPVQRRRAGDPAASAVLDPVGPTSSRALTTDNDLLVPIRMSQLSHLRIQNP